MPITNDSSFVPTMLEFETHWANVNAFLTPNVLTLTNGFTLAMFTTLRQTIQTANTAVNQDLVEVDDKRNDLLTQKKELMATLEMFRRAVQSDMDFTSYKTNLPVLPHITETQSKFLKPFEQASYLWHQINTNPPDGFTPPLALPDGTVVADFDTAITALNAAYKSVITSKGKLSLARSNRSSNFVDARYYMKQYRVTVQARLLPGNPLLNNLPRYTPVAGSTPKGVTNLLFTYNETTNTVKLAFSPSISKNITEYALRYSPGAKYNPANEQTIATLPATGPFEFDFALDFVAAGTTALFKVYVLNATGNHRASKVIKIKRTAETLLTLTPSNVTLLQKAA